jgi:hypothetical protein
VNVSPSGDLGDKRELGDLLSGFAIKTTRKKFRPRQSFILVYLPPLGHTFPISMYFICNAGLKTRALGYEQIE